MADLDHARGNARTRRALLSTAAVGIMIAIGMPGASADVSSVSGGAFGESVNVKPLNLVAVTSGPLPTVSLPASGGGPFTNSLVSVSVPNYLSTGLLEVSTQGATGASGFATSSASVANANVLNGVLKATAIRSTCTSTESGSTGSTTLVGAVLALPGTSPVNLAANPAPNTTIQVDGIKVVLNEQTTSSSGITVNAVHITLSGLLGSGDIYISQSRCGVAATPATTTTVAPTTTTSKVTTTTVAPTTTTAAPTTTTTTAAPKKCNAGNGNTSETEPSNDCDPGGSPGHNQGGD